MADHAVDVGLTRRVEAIAECQHARCSTGQCRGCLGCRGTDIVGNIRFVWRTKTALRRKRCTEGDSNIRIGFRTHCRQDLVCAGNRSVALGNHPRRSGPRKTNARAILPLLIAALICSAQLLFPEFDYPRREFASSNACALAGLWPHFKQGIIPAEEFALRNLLRFGMRPSLRFHFQKLYQRCDIFFFGVHDGPPQGELKLVERNLSVSDIKENAFDRSFTQVGLNKFLAVSRYFGTLSNQLYVPGGYGGLRGPR